MSVKHACGPMESNIRKFVESWPHDIHNCMQKYYIFLEKPGLCLITILTQKPYTKL